MTKGDILKTFLEDSILTEKNYSTPEKLKNMTFDSASGVKLIEIIKLAVGGNKDDESESVSVRKINQFLNK